MGPHETQCTSSKLPPAHLRLQHMSITASHTETGLTFPQWRGHNTRPAFSFTFESIFNFSLFHSQPVSTKTLSLAKISFWQTMQWIKGHTWPLSCSLGDQTHFQGQELLTGLFNPQREARNWTGNMAMDLGSEPAQTKVLEDRTRQMVFFLVNFRTSTVRGFNIPWAKPSGTLSNAAIVEY